jgi:threo-3-hydroxy-L-aspartate ammonia-lyase
MSVDLSLEHVRDAARRLAGRVWTTPVIRNPTLDARAGRELFLKAENLQRIGAFKARGALHAVLRLPDDQRARGVVTYSSGNHAQAVALAAREFAVPAWIAMPTDAPAIKVAGVRALGAEIVFAGTTSEDRHRAALELCARHHAAMIEPFDDPDIIAGQGTATLELCEHVLATTGAPLDALVVPVGGGGLLAGAGLVTSALGISLYAAEPATCNAMARSLAAGERIAVPPGPTLADGLRPIRVGALNFELARRSVAAGFEVDDDELGRALVDLLLSAKILVEPSGAAALAVALRGPSTPSSPPRGGFPGQRVGVLLSGGNVDPALVAELLTRHT